MKGLLTRTISGIIYITLITFCILYSKVAFIELLLLLGVIAAEELTQLIKSDNTATKYTAILDSIGALLLIASFSFANLSDVDAALAIGLYLIYVIIRLVAQLYLPKIDAIRSLANSMFVQAYAILPLALMTLLYSKYGTPHLVLAIFIMIWLNDTGAFLVGSLCGRHRLFPRISPKKSWEGFCGGMVFTVAAGVIFGTYFTDYVNGFGIGIMAGCGALVSIFATWGDLVESLIKRTVGVKDSGNIIPGHGGILDRIDSLLLVIPAMVIYFIAISYFI
jgi:phosphatidate cytidylyltransferase